MKDVGKITQSTQVAIFLWIFLKNCALKVFSFHCYSFCCSLVSRNYNFIISHISKISAAEAEFVF